LSLYAPPSNRQAVASPAELEFGGRLRLERVVGDSEAVPAGESLRLTLTWVVSETLDADVKLDFSLLDEKGNRWLQWHRVPGRWRKSPSNWEVGDIITDRQGLVVPQGAPPGRYTLRLAAVDAQSNEPLWPSGGNSSLAQADVEILSFEVIEPISPPVLLDAGEFMGPFQFTSPGDPTDTLTLAGYELGGLKFTQGNPVALRLHWLVSFKRGGKTYFFADSNRPGHIAGPYKGTREFIQEYAQYRGRKILTFREVDSYQKRQRARTLRLQASEKP